MVYRIKKLKTTAIYPTGKYKITGEKIIEKPLMIYIEDGYEYLIKTINFRETTANKNFADVTFYNKSGNWTIDINKIKNI
jgi:TATA-box binding protein (TBP) (component of TFIID and TFIIIB)